MIEVPTAPALHLLAGPNGSGKSSLVADTIGPVTELPFVNADVIAAELWPGEEVRHAKEASQLAEQQRDDYMAERVSFLTETVFSHPSKVKLVADAIEMGYDVTLHVVVVPVELSIARVARRVEQGGHDVPQRKIRERYERLWPLVVQAAQVATETIVYDNSSATASHRRIAVVRSRPLSVALLGARPSWLPVALAELLDG